MTVKFKGTSSIPMRYLNGASLDINNISLFVNGEYPSKIIAACHDTWVFVVATEEGGLILVDGDYISQESIDNFCGPHYKGNRWMEAQDD